MTIFLSRHAQAVAVALLSVCLCRASSAMFSGTAPANLGVRDGCLAPCPDKPNCVSSQAEGKAYIEPLSFDDAPDAALARLKTILHATPRVRITAQTPDYLRAEAASLVFGFVDDLEFYFDFAGRVVHVRSAARLGYSDLGVNRKRLEAIRQRFGRSSSRTK